jgi:hypothetical protein
MKLFFFLLVFIMTAQFSFSQNELEFIEEDITFELKNDTFLVKGIYYFYSALASENKYSIYYPFPNDSIYYPATNIFIYNVNDSCSIDYMQKNNHSIGFQAKVKGLTPIIISYKQRLKIHKAEYILLSTNFWEKPLKNVSYKLLVPSNIKVSKFSINPDKYIEVAGKLVFLWQKENYKPDRNFIVEYTDN